MLESLILYFKGMRIIMFQLFPFYDTQTLRLRFQALKSLTTPLTAITKPIKPHFTKPPAASKEYAALAA